MSTVPVVENLRRLRDRIAEIAAAAGRNPAEVRLVAVSKTVEPERIRAAYDAGQRSFGENRVQELLSKTGLLPSDCEWHLIGHLQRNKVRLALRHAAWVHSVDSTDLIVRLEQIAAEEQRCPCILLQVNVSAEESKSGVAPCDLQALLETVHHCRQLRCSGLMTIAPYGAAEPVLRRVFAALRELRDRAAGASGIALPELSMGMSGDYDSAIREGATMLRIGTAIFGARD